MEKIFKVCEICHKLSLAVPTKGDIEIMRKQGADTWFDIYVCKECQKGV